MRDLQRVAMECVNDMRYLGIDVPHGITFIVNKRAKSRFGQCSYNGFTKLYTIDINVDLLDERCPMLSLKETLYHEIIHTLPNCMNHGSEFKHYAYLVNTEYGTNVTRCSSSNEKYRKETKRKRKNMGYIAKIAVKLEQVECTSVCRNGMHTLKTFRVVFVTVN